MRSEEAIPGIIDDLYAGTLDQAAWNRAMTSMADLVSATGTLLFGINPTNAHIFRDEIHRFDAVAVAEYRNHWFSKDIRYEPGLRLPAGEAIFESRILRLKHFRSSEIYNDYLMRVDSPWFLVFWLFKTLHKVVVLSIQGSRNRGPFDERDGELIKPLIPHVRRALEIKDRLEVAHIRSDNLAKTLDCVNFGVLILDTVGHVLEASAIAEDLLRKRSGLGRNSDMTLWLNEPAGAELNRWILTGAPPRQNVDGLLHAPRLNSAPLSVMVTRLPDMGASWFGSGSPGWMLLLFDPDRQLPASAEMIARDMGISAREAEIAALLATGYDMSVIARRLNISIHTVRTHLKAIFAKTGSRSQTELILRIRSGPGGINAFR
jgi:DNA-binding CsgD family transcriptional regulator/PAS domain-containing protein